MKQIFLESLELENFQKFDFYHVDFASGSTFIKGDNGTGKTTLYSSITWLMFGKDAYDRKEFDIRRKVNGKTDFEADTKVKGDFVIVEDGFTTRMTLERGLHGKEDKQGVWHDDTFCYVDGVPKLVSEYQTIISQIIPEEEFKILTSINYFLSLDMEVQRDYLCRMAGIREVADIIKGESSLEIAYSKKPENMSLEDFIKSSKDSLKRWKDDKKTIQPTINALINSKPTEENWEEVEDKRNQIKDEINSVNEQISSIDKAIQAKEGNRNLILMSIEEQKKNIQKAQKEAIDKKEDLRRENERTYKLSLQEYNDLMRDYQSTKQRVENLEQSLKSSKEFLAETDKELDALAAKYNSESDSKDGYVCAALKTVCPKLQEDPDFAKKIEEGRAKTLEEIIRKGKSLKERFNQTKVNIEMQENGLSDARSKYEVLSRKVSDAIAPEKKDLSLQEKQIDDDLVKEIEVLRHDLSVLEEKAEVLKVERNDSDLKTKQKDLISQLEEITKTLAKRDQILAIENQIDETRKKGVEIADNITYYTNLVEDLQTINRMIIDDAAIRINAMFKVTHWETSVQLKNKTYKDICRPTIDGVSASLNSAARINIGLDIINAISNYKKIKAFVFLDNRESINEPLQLDMQMIHLFVAPSGTPLTVE